MICEEFEELSGAYALGAVTPEEQDAARAHLAECANCTRLSQELRAVVDLLPLSVTQVDPPASLKEHLLEAIRNERAATRTPPAQTSQYTRRRWRWSTQLLAAAALILVLLGGMTAWNVSLQQQNSSLAHQVTSLHQQIVSLNKQVTALQHQVALAYAIQGNVSAQAATGKLIYLPQQDITLLVVEGLPQLQGTHVYQGWLIHGKQPKSIGLFSVQNRIASLTFPGNIAGYELAAVSMEPGPAASKGVPAGPVMAAGELTHPILPE